MVVAEQPLKFVTWHQNLCEGILGLQEFEAKLHKDTHEIKRLAFRGFPALKNIQFTRRSNFMDAISL